MKYGLCSYTCSCLTKFLKFLILLTVFVFLNYGLGNPAYCQEESVEGETVVSLEADAKSMDSAVLKQDYSKTKPSLQIALDPVNALEKKALENAPKEQPLQIGFGRDFPADYRGDLIPLLDWEQQGDGSLVASFSVASPDARAIRIALQANGIPNGVEFRFFSLSYSDQIFGPFTAKDIEKKGKSAKDSAGHPFTFWSPVIEGDTIGVEIYMPPSSMPPKFTLEISQISHIFSSVLNPDEKRLSEIGRSGSCNIDVNCRTTNPSTLPDATAKILFTKSGGTYLCTGTLLNDADTDSRIPYFMTANHCVNTQSAADTINSYWFFERSYCGGPNPTSVVQRTNGGELIATSTSTDFTFLQLDDNPPSGSHYTSWISSALGASSTVVGIHHPQGDLKKYSRGTATGNAPYLGNINGTGNHIRTVWNQGTTEGGSSGSGLFDTSGRFRGQLHGGYASCSQLSSPDWYGRFDVTYPSVRPWLFIGASALSNNVSRFGSVTQGKWKEYKINVPSTVPFIRVQLYGLSNDADLYIRENVRNTPQAYDCRSTASGTTSDECVKKNNGSNTWYIGVRGYGAGTTNFYVRAQFQYSCPLSPGHYDYCRDCGPCNSGQGDCDGNSECQSGLTCVNDVGANYGWPADVDVCQGNNCNVYQPGLDWCRDCGPCSVGQSDCDNDSECAGT